MGVNARHSRTELLVHAAVGCSVMFQCTIRRVPTSNTTKTLPRAEARRNGDEEIAREHRAGLVAHEGAPSLRRSAIVRAPASRHVTLDGARRHGDAKLDPVNQPGKYDEREPYCIIGPAGSDSTLRVACELLRRNRFLVVNRDRERKPSDRNFRASTRRRTGGSPRD